MAVYLAHLVSTWFMVGVIWYVQLVHYPTFDWIARDRFTAFEKRHRLLTSVVVMPVMLTEVFSGLWLLWHFPKLAVLILNILLLALLWVVTFLISVPLHQKLETSYDADAVKRLVSSNWLRTLFWTARGFLLLSLYEVIV